MISRQEGGTASTVQETVPGSESHTKQLDNRELEEKGEIKKLGTLVSHEKWHLYDPFLIAASGGYVFY